MADVRKLLDQRNHEVLNLKQAIQIAIAALKRDDPQDALLTLIAATLANDPEQWSPTRDQ